MAREINRMFSLTKYKEVVVSRSQGDGDWSDTTGKWVPATRAEITINANIQPYKFSQTMMLDASERTKEWINIWTTSELRKMKEGSGGWEADRLTYNNNIYKVMEVQRYQMGVLDHYRVRAALDSPTPAGA